MATFSSAHYLLQKASRANPSRLAPANVSSGEVQFALIPYTLAATEAAADLIELCLLPKDAIVIPQLSHVTCSADPGTTLTLDIGNADNPDGAADGIVLSAGGQVAFTNTAIPAWVAQTPLVEDVAGGDGNTLIYATVASANTLTVSVVLYFVIAYKLGR